MLGLLGAVAPAAAEDEPPPLDGEPIGAVVTDESTTTEDTTDPSPGDDPSENQIISTGDAGNPGGNDVPPAGEDTGQPDEGANPTEGEVNPSGEPADGEADGLTGEPDPSEGEGDAAL